MNKQQLAQQIYQEEKSNKKLIVIAYKYKRQTA